MIGPFTIDYKGSLPRSGMTTRTNSIQLFNALANRGVQQLRSSNRPSLPSDNPLNSALNANQFNPTLGVSSAGSALRQQPHTRSRDCRQHQSNVFQYDIEGNARRSECRTACAIEEKFSGSPADLHRLPESGDLTNDFTLAQAMAGHLNTDYSGYWQIGFSGSREIEELAPLSSRFCPDMAGDQ